MIKDSSSILIQILSKIEKYKLKKILEQNQENK